MEPNPSSHSSNGTQLKYGVTLQTFLDQIDTPALVLDFNLLESSARSTRPSVHEIIVMCNKACIAEKFQSHFQRFMETKLDLNESSQEESLVGLGEHTLVWNIDGVKWESFKSGQFSIWRMKGLDTIATFQAEGNTSKIAQLSGEEALKRLDMVRTIHQINFIQYLRILTWYLLDSIPY